MTQSAISTASSTHGLIAVRDEDSNDKAGVIVWWRLTGGIDLAALETAWVAEGLEKSRLPTPPSPPVALRRAVSELKTAKRMVRPLDKGGFAVLDEHQSGDRVSTQQLGTVTLDPLGRIKSDLPWRETDAVAEAYEKHLHSVVQSDVSPWLCKTMDAVQAVSLRDTGGVYFVPRYALPQWERVVRALRAATQHVISNVPALTSSEAVSAILDALEQEAGAQLAQLESDLDAHMKDETDPDAKKLGSRALNTRIERTEAMGAKLGAYESLLGSKLDALRENISRARANLSVAMFSQQAAEDAS
jgi:hypothetical protein